jgi:glucose-6-phosphate-specific signal transduction histidine kinase
MTVPIKALGRRSPVPVELDVQAEQRLPEPVDRGSGLVGLTDRVEALGGKLTLHSPPAGGTMLPIDLPLSGEEATTLDAADQPLA